MDDILHDYTAGELLEWLKNIVVDDYTVPVIQENGCGDTAVLYTLDIESIKTDFMREIHRYEVVRRGYTFYIHDNKTCQDIFSWHFNDNTESEVQETAMNTCKSLNDRTMRFIGRKESCY